MEVTQEGDMANRSVDEVLAEVKQAMTACSWKVIPGYEPPIKVVYEGTDGVWLLLVVEFTRNDELVFDAVATDLTTKTAYLIHRGLAEQMFLAAQAACS
jgi:hypothetical protein